MNLKAIKIEILLQIFSRLSQWLGCSQVCTTSYTTYCCSQPVLNFIYLVGNPRKGQDETEETKKPLAKLLASHLLLADFDLVYFVRGEFNYSLLTVAKLQLFQSHKYVLVLYVFFVAHLLLLLLFDIVNCLFFCFELSLSLMFSPLLCFVLSALAWRVSSFPWCSC